MRSSGERLGEEGRQILGHLERRGGGGGGGVDYLGGGGGLEGDGRKMIGRGKVVWMSYGGGRGGSWDQGPP